MKAILEFNIPEEQEEFEIASNAWKLKSIIVELDNRLRNVLKHEQDSHTVDELNSSKKIRDYLHESLTENNINLY
jgi:hypothetical protein